MGISRRDGRMIMLVALVLVVVMVGYLVWDLKQIGRR
jgi:type IV secretory pathway TrbF-like protein